MRRLCKVDECWARSAGLHDCRREALAPLVRNWNPTACALVCTRDAGVRLHRTSHTPEQQVPAHTRAVYVHGRFTPIKRVVGWPVQLRASTTTVIVGHTNASGAVNDGPTWHPSHRHPGHAEIPARSCRLMVSRAGHCWRAVCAAGSWEAREACARLRLKRLWREPHGSSMYGWACQSVVANTRHSKHVRYERAYSAATNRSGWYLAVRSCGEGGEGGVPSDALNGALACRSKWALTRRAHVR